MTGCEWSYSDQMLDPASSKNCQLLRSSQVCNSSSGPATLGFPSLFKPKLIPTKNFNKFRGIRLVEAGLTQQKGVFQHLRQDGRSFRCRQRQRQPPRLPGRSSSWQVVRRSLLAVFLTAWRTRKSTHQHRKTRFDKSNWKPDAFATKLWAWSVPRPKGSLRVHVCDVKCLRSIATSRSGSQSFHGIWAGCGRSATCRFGACTVFFLHIE